MGGEARGNPRSPQYRGPLPEVVTGVQFQARIQPNLAFMARVEEMRAAGVQPSGQVAEEDLDVVFVMRGMWTAPTRLSDKWPQAQFDVTELARMPYVEFKARAAECFTGAGNPDFTASAKIAPQREDIAQD